ncbi:MAG TPA: biopolymer transporter ExbD [Candidatus Aminicenantes bacterium]|nr:biopolymer transporter ExbD [Candidatus Aminicenantes bacterium]
MSMKISNAQEVSSEPNVVPLCDVLLVLLIIFMVVTPLIQKGIDVRLPVALNTINMPESPEVVLSIRKDGKMYIGQDQITMENLQTMIEEAFMTASDKRLYLRADGELEYGNIVDVVEILKAAGVEIVGIITEIKTERID